MSLTTVGMLGITEQAERSATKVTIRKVNGLLRDRIDAYDRTYKSDVRRDFIVAAVEQLRSNSNVATTFDPLLTYPDGAESGIRVLARKFGFRYFFPQRMKDLTVIDGDTQITGVSDVVYARIMAPVARQQLVAKGTPSPTAAEILNQATSNWNSNHDPVTESSELLYFALVHSSVLGASPMDADRFMAAEVSDTDGDGLPEFVDHWEQPLRFYRWPTRLVDRNGDGTVSDAERQIARTQLRGVPDKPYLANERDLALVDPDDPVGVLSTFVFNYSNEPIDGGIADLEVDNEIKPDNYHTLETFHAPLIVSAGIDERLGLGEPYEVNTAAPGHLGYWEDTDASKDAMYDNLTNRSGGAGGAR